MTYELPSSGYRGVLVLHVGYVVSIESFHLGRGGATLSVAAGQATGKGRKEERHSEGHSCQELPPQLLTLWQI